MALAVRCMRGGFPDVCCETAIGCYSNRGATSNSCKEVGPAEPFAIRAKTRQSVQWGVWQHVVTLAARQSADCHDKRKIVQRSLSLHFFRQRAAGAASWRNLSPDLLPMSTRAVEIHDVLGHNRLLITVTLLLIVSLFWLSLSWLLAWPVSRICAKKVGDDDPLGKNNCVVSRSLLATLWLRVQEL